jgi:uncharacterized protein (DUF1684 family)
MRTNVTARSRGRVVATALGACLVAAAFTDNSAGAEESTAGADYLEKIEEWRSGRVERLTTEDGWLSLVGLFWLEPGENLIGSGSENSVLLPSDKAPEQVGVLTVEDGKARITISPNVEVTQHGTPVHTLQMNSDAKGEPTVLTLGDLTFFIIDRDGSLAVRVKDRRSTKRNGFKGIKSFPVDATWRFAAKFDPYDPPRQIPIATINGQLIDSPSSGALVFDVAGQSLRLDVLAEPGDDSLFVIFSDETTGRDTYGGGRYLYTDPPGPDGVVDLDFNKAYNPPCVFTDYATCPLPPRQNRLPIRIEAGEMDYKTQ